MPTLFDASSKTKAPAKLKKVVSVKKPTVIHATSPMGPLTCFAVNPAGIRFETQEEDEVVVLFLRQHVIINLPWVLITALLVLAPSVLFPFLGRFLSLPVQLPVGYVIVGTLFWYIATFGYALVNFLSWFFNIYIVTNQRVVDIDFVHLLYKEFSEARLTNIQDITYTSGGIFAAFFNYGNAQIQTAAELPNFEFTNVPYPERVVQTIGELLKTVKGNTL